jgi:DNA-binding beta-propeller fold protein YncE
MGEGCFMGDASYVWEASPQTAFLRLFADTEDGLCAPTGMIFTPDGTRLRVANYGVNTIMDFYPDGNGVVVYEVGDGISRPGRNNGITFDRQGNFFVLSEGSLRIIKFPRDERLPQIFADRNDGIITSGGMTADAEGNIYVGQAEKILVFTPQGEPAVFDEFVFNADVLTLTIDDDDDLFAGVEWPNSGDRVYRYQHADATRRELVIEGQEQTWGNFTITMSPNANELYKACFGQLYAIDIETGFRRLVPISGPGGNRRVDNNGLAVYIPPRAGDLNYDKVVDLADFELFADCLAGPGITDPPLPCPAKRFTAADLTRDGDVDAEDFSRLQSALDRP